MTAATQDRLLAVLLVALAATGLVSLRMGASNEAWLFAFHGLLAAVLAVTALAKIGRSLPKAVAARRWRGVVLGSVLSLATVASVIAGFAWVASGRLLTVGAWTVLTLHAWIGIVLIPIAIAHLAPRRWRLLVPRQRPASSRRAGPVMTRRSLLTAGILGATSIALFGIAEAADRLTGGVRRFTGSRWLPAGGVPPTTTFLGEGAPELDAEAWRLHVHGQGADARLSRAELTALGVVDRTATLDCTSGWALETTWRGIPLTTVLEAAGAVAAVDRGVIIRAATGWSTTVGPEELDHAFLAFGVGGGPLPVANGAPCRLVLPDHRGLDWVKWVVEVEVQTA